MTHEEAIERRDYLYHKEQACNLDKDERYELQRLITKYGNPPEPEEITVEVTDIDWDLDEDDEADLPTEITFSFTPDEDPDYDLGDQIVDYLTDEYGYCINGLDYEVL